MHLAAIALGSNLASAWGDREATLSQAVRLVALLGNVRAVSSFYSTAPVGYSAQPDFLNAALLLETQLEPLDLMRSLLQIEQAMGRSRAASPSKGPRVIDLDLLLIDDLILDVASNPGPMPTPADSPTPQVLLTLPHPAMADRRFVLEPLAEIAPTLIDPRSNRSIAELLAQLPPPPPGQRQACQEFTTIPRPTAGNTVKS
jgi:2-amino-4-hydroxy-6-hydroxymethyldihydropteridine diphosphokinase